MTFDALGFVYDHRFALFLNRCNAAITAISPLSLDDWADAPWRDLYEDLGDAATDDDILACLAEADDTFAAFLETIGREVVF